MSQCLLATWLSRFTKTYTVSSEKGPDGPFFFARMTFSHVLNRNWLEVVDEGIGWRSKEVVLTAWSYRPVNFLLTLYLCGFGVSKALSARPTRRPSPFPKRDKALNLCVLDQRFDERAMLWELCHRLGYFVLYAL